MNPCAYPGKILSLALITLFAASLSTPTSHPDKFKSSPDHAPGVPLPLEAYFEPNVGQSHADVKFLSRGSDTVSFLTAREVVIVPTTPIEHGHGRGSPSTLRIHWLEGNPNPEMSGLSIQPGRSNYFRGNDSRDWRTNVPNYGAIQYKNLYAGVDLIYRTKQDDFEYDFIVQPHANPGLIKLQFNGQKSLHKGADGSLILDLGSGRMTQLRPTVFQEFGGRRKVIAAAYVEHSPGVFSFQLGKYDRNRPLVIDPVLTYASYLGGRRNEIANGVTVDSRGNTYLIGTTTSPDFPTAHALQETYHEIFVDPLGSCHPFDSPFRTPCPDVFVIKLNPDGSIAYSTYLGGNSWDQGISIAADASGNAYLTGSTEGGFPLANAFQSTFGGRSTTQVIVGDAFVAKLDASGSQMVYSTYMGGSFDDQGTGIKVNSSGEAIVAGWTSSSTFPVRNPLQRENKITNPIVGSSAFVAKFDNAGGLEWSTFLGGSGVVADKATSVAIQFDGSIYVAGQAESTDFPTTSDALQRTKAGGTDAFVAKINPAGTNLVYSTYVGGARNDVANAVTVGESGNAYVSGSTNSANFPLAKAIQAGLVAGDCNGSPCEDAFITELDAAGTAAIFSTYLGGAGADAATAIAIDPTGAVLATGRTGSSNFPITPGSPRFGGVSDAFLVKALPQLGTLIFSWYFGGSGADAATSMALDNSENIVIAGSTASSDLPAIGAIQNRLGGGVGDFGVASGDAFVARFANSNDPPQVTRPVALFPGGIVNGASFGSGAAVAPGSIVSVFGTSMGIEASAQFVPLLTTLGDSSVDIGGFAAPLFFTSSGQINLQIPWELQGQQQASIAVFSGGTWSPQQTVRLQTFAPGIFSISQNGNGQGAILIANTAELAAPGASIPGIGARPAQRGSAVSIFCTGLGPVNNPPQTGWPASANPASETLTSPVVVIGGIGGRLLFSGLAPGFVGLYQVNVEVPADAPIGDAVPLLLSIGGVSSNTITVAIN